MVRREIVNEFAQEVISDEKTRVLKGKIDKVQSPYTFKDVSTTYLNGKCKCYEPRNGCLAI